MFAPALSQEHFKECEKEAKLKPFAKAALASKNERVDPILQAKEEAQRWLRDSVNCLAEQVEGFEVNPCCRKSCCMLSFQSSLRALRRPLSMLHGSLSCR